MSIRTKNAGPYLRLLAIDNFQSHEHTAVELSPGINVLVGPSDSGKSSVVRALRWLAANRPTGDSVRSWWGGDTTVAASFADGVEVLRFRDGSRNGYKLCTAKLKAHTMTAIQTDVPKPVRDALNMDEGNFQFQHDPPFLLSNSAGEVARTINAIVHLDVIDRALSRINAKVTETRVEVARLTAQGEAKRREAEGMAWVDSAGKLMEEAKDLDDGLEKITKRCDAVDALAQNIERLEERRAAIPDVDGMGAKLDGLAEAIGGVPRDEELERLVARTAEITRTRDHLDAQIVELETELWQTMPEECPTCGQRIPKRK